MSIELLPYFRMPWVPLNVAMLGEVLGGQHEASWTIDADAKGTWRCACGWSISFMRDVFILTRNGAGPAEVWRHHLLDVLATFNPTLADFTDWGWFSPEVDP